MSTIYLTMLRKDIKGADNTCLAKVAVQCPADTFVLNKTLVLCINICDGNHHFLQTPKTVLYAE